MQIANTYVNVHYCLTPGSVYACVQGAKLAMILEQACIDQRVGRELKRMWRSGFEKRPASQSTVDCDSYVL